MDRQSYPRHSCRRQDRLQSWHGGDEPPSAVGLSTSHRAHKGWLLQDASAERSGAEVETGNKNHLLESVGVLVSSSRMRLQSEAFSKLLLH